MVTAPALDDEVRLRGSERDRHDFYTQGRPLRLSDFQLKALEMIAKSTKQGITQSDLAKALQIDPRNLFHQLKNLLAFQVITRLPVSYQKSFTYLLYLARFAPRDDVDLIDLTRGGPEERRGASVLPSVISIRSRIMDLLQTAPGRTLPATEVYRLLGDLNHIRIYRRNISWLVCKGYIECFIAQELGGVPGKILKFKKSYGEVEKKAPSPQPSPRPASRPFEERCSAAVRGLSMERQVHDYIDAAGPRGVTLTEIMGRFGVDRKYAYRIGERLCGKIFSNSQIIKIAEFVGKERRHRFFTRTGQSRSETSIASETPSSIQRDSITRMKRLEKLLEVVEEHVIVESGKPLVLMIQGMLQEQDFQMDGKTLKRMVKQLETEGRLRTFVVVLNGMNRLIITRADVSPDDPRVKEYIEKMRRSKSELTAPSSADLALPAAEATAEMEHAKEHKYRLQKYGYVFGIFQRCRLLHTYLMETIILPRLIPNQGQDHGRGMRDEGWLCETLPAFFRALPLSLFLRIVGVGEMSSQLSAYLRNERNHHLALEELPPWVKEELHRRRVDRHKTVVKTLMDILGRLGLAAVDNRYPSVAFRLPFQYRLSRLASVIDVRSQKIVKTIEFVNAPAVEEYWNWLATLPESVSTLLAEGTLEALPDVYRAACTRENWQIISPFSRSFRKALRRLLDGDVQQREQAIDTLAADFDIDRDVVLREYHVLEEEVQRMRGRRAEERRERRLKRDKTIRPPLYPRPASDESSESEEETAIVTTKGRRAVLHSFSPTDLETLRLGYFVLYLPQFRGPAGTIRWSLLSRIIGTVLGSGEELRAFFARFQNSFDQSQKMLRLERTLQTIDALVEDGLLSAPPTIGEDVSLEEGFETMFKYYQDASQKVDEAKQRLRARQTELLRAGEDIFHLRVGPLYKASSIFDPELLFKRMSRSQQFRYFSSTSYLIPAPKTPPVGQASAESAVWIAMKKTLAAPLGSYDSGQMKEYLSVHGRDSIEECIQEMIAAGLLTRGDSVRFRLRVPGSDFLVHEQFIALVEGEQGHGQGWEGPMERGDTGSGSGSGNGGGDALRGGEGEERETDLMEGWRAVAAGRMRICFEMTRGVPVVKMAAAGPSRPAKRPRKTAALTTAISRHFEGASSSQYLWMGMRGERRPDILRAVCRYVYEMVAVRPGISLRNLQEGGHPFVSPSEVAAAVQVLEQAELVKAEDGMNNYFVNM